MILMNNIYRHRHLVLRLATTDFKLRYKNSILGFFWSLLEPLFMLIVLYIVFSNLMRVDVEHYQLFLLLGIICWGFFEKGTGMGINSIVGNPSMVKKVYFPREILVMSSCLTALFMTLLEFIVFAGFMVIFRVMPGVDILVAPFIFLIEFILIFGIALALSSINVLYRDIQYIWKVVLQAGFFATPILYQTSMLPAPLVPFLNLNPMARVIEMMRDLVIYNKMIGIGDVLYIMIISLGMLVIGYLIFARIEPRFAEEV